jgi:hypothetical protein
MINGQQSTDTVKDRRRRDNNGNLGPGVDRFYALDLIDECGFERRMEPSGDDLEHLARFWSKQFAVAINAGPVAVNKGHRIAADRTIGRRSFVELGEDGQLDIVFVHDQPVEKAAACRPNALLTFAITPRVGAFSAARPSRRSPDSARRRTSAFHR